MKEVYIVVYHYPIEDGHDSKVSQLGFEDLEEARKWCARNGATPNENRMIYFWDAGYRSFEIIPIQIERSK